MELGNMRQNANFGNGQKNKKNIKYYYCHRFGHYKSECNKLKNNNAQRINVLDAEVDCGTSSKNQ